MDRDRERECVCVRKREREWDREIETEKQRESKERERERESVCERECVCVRERESVWDRERESKERECVRERERNRESIIKSYQLSRCTLWRKESPLSQRWQHPAVDITWSMDITWSISENHGFRIRFETQIRGFQPLAHVMSVAHILFTSGHRYKCQCIANKTYKDTQCAGSESRWCVSN